MAPRVESEARIAREVLKVFAGRFSCDAHLDVMFLSQEQESDLRRVCSPFYEAGVPRLR
jgi:hypothetical protein